MSDDERYQSWLETMRDDVPDDFVDRVMERIEAAAPRRGHRSRLAMDPMALSRAAVVAIGVLAVIACLARLRHAVSVFMPS